jgi:hypothetical protein
MRSSSQKNIEKRKPIKQEGKVDIPRSRNEKESEFCFLQIESPMVFFLTFKLYYNLELQTGLPALTRNKQVLEHTHLNPLSFPCMYIYGCASAYIYQWQDS